SVSSMPSQQSGMEDGKSAIVPSASPESLCPMPGCQTWLLTAKTFGTNPTELLYDHALISGHSIVLLHDDSTGSNFILHDIALSIGTPLCQHSNPFQLEVADGSQHIVEEYVKQEVKVPLDCGQQ